MPLPFVNRAAWIWSAEGTHAVPPPGAASPSHYQVRMFRRAFSLASAGGARGEVQQVPGIRHRAGVAAMRLVQDPVAGGCAVGVESFEPAAPKLAFDMRPELVGNPRRQILHGGVISATLDVAGGFAILIAHAEDREITPESFPDMGTIDLRIDYLRPGRGKHFVATAKIVRKGSRIAVVHTELHNDAGELIATGAAAYVIG